MSSEGGSEPPGSGQDVADATPTGTVVLMPLFLAAIAAFWIVMYRLLLER